MDNDYIKEYDISPNKKEIGGTSNKRFARVKSSYFKEFISEIKSGNENYITYVNDVIKSGYVPEYLSAMVRAPRGSSIYFMQNNSHVFNEILASRLANEMDIKTVYAIDMSINHRPHALILDFLKNNETIMDFNEFAGNDMWLGLPMSGWYEYANQAFKFRNPNKSEDERNILLDDFMKDFVKIFYFKNFIIGDGDFAPHNLSMIKDGDTYTLAPCYDNEMGFDAFCTGTNIKQDLFDDYADFMNNRYPEIFKELIRKTQVLSRNIDSIINREIYDEEEKIRLKRFCNAYLNSLFACINSYQQNKGGKVQ